MAGALDDIEKGETIRQSTMRNSRGRHTPFESWRGRWLTFTRFSIYSTNWKVKLRPAARVVGTGRARRLRISGFAGVAVAA